jgi:hypothetical protein
VGRAKPIDQQACLRQCQSASSNIGRSHAIGGGVQVAQVAAQILGTEAAPDGQHGSEGKKILGPLNCVAPLGLEAERES